MTTATPTGISRAVDGGRGRWKWSAWREEVNSYGSIVEVGWLDLRSPLDWDPLLRDDPITFPLLQCIRAALGYQHHLAVPTPR